MKSLCVYLMEALKQNIDGVIDIFMKHLDDLSAVRKQHFINRISMCDTRQAKGISISSDIESTIRMTKDVCNLYKGKKYYEIIKKYVISPYDGISKDKDKVKEWLLSYKDGMPAKYLALGYLSTKLDIIERTGNVDKLDNLDEIYGFYDDIDDMVKFHNEDPIDCKTKCGTLYVNFMGNTYYVLNSPHMNFHKKIDIEEWRKTRRIFYEAKEFNYSSVYGVTHCIINGCRYYVEKLDTKEFARELDFIRRFLQECRKNKFELKDFLTIDILAEAALCEKLANSDEYDEWKDVKDHLDTLIDKETGILQSNDRYKDDTIHNLENNEHSNILFILLHRYRLPK